MRLSVIPFQNIRACVDIKTKEVFIGQNELDAPDLDDLLKHEIAHYISEDPDHGEVWQELSGEDLPQIDLVKLNRKRYGIKSSLACNIGNITGINQMLTDLHLLQAYRRFAGKVLGTEGHFEVIGEVDGDATQQLIRLYPTPKGVFPVVVVYIPVVNNFRSPTAKLLAHRMLLAEVKTMVGMARRKIAGMPTPDGGSLALDGEALVAEGEEMKANIVQEAINLSQPLGVYKW